MQELNKKGAAPTAPYTNKQLLHTYLSNSKKVQTCQGLSEWVLEDLNKSGLSLEIIQEMGVWMPVNSEEVKKILKFNPFRNSANEGYFIPYLHVQGQNFQRLKLKYPQSLKENEKPAKYLSPSNAGVHLYALPHDWKKRNNPKAHIIICEGEKKTAKVSQHARNLETEFQKYCVLGVGGATSWNCPEWNEVILNSKTIYLAFDADYTTNITVAKSVLKLILFLHSKGVKEVKTLIWDLERGKGIDDYLVSQPDPDATLQNLIKQSKDAIQYFTFSLSIDDIANIFGYAHAFWKVEYTCFLDILKQNTKVDKNKIKSKIKESAKKYIQEERKKQEEEKRQKLKEFFGFEFIVPEPWCVTNGILLRIQMKKNIEYIPICPFFAVVKQSIDEEGNGLLVLQKLDGQKTIIPAQVNEPKRLGIDAELTRFLGVLDRKKMDAVCTYIADFVLWNRDKIPTQKARRSCGWSDEKYYIPTNHPEVKWLPDGDGRLDAICISGDENETYRKQVKMLSFILECKAGIAVLASLAAPLLKIIKVPNHMLYFASPTRSGKTTALRFAMSIWGEVDGLMNTLNNTLVASELLSKIYRDFPLWLDEIETLGKKHIDDFVSLVYMYTQGKGRSRGNINVLLRKTAKFRGVLLCSGEKDLDSIVAMLHNRNRPLGVWNRVLQIEDVDLWKTFSDSKVINLKDINLFCYTYFGAFGKKYAELIEKNIEKIKEIYEEKTKIFNSVNMSCLER
ncbi:MAG: DUF927 domain-containing protein [Candidatus Desulfofervidaceae bacterium]|nr:DUF927 domain-containing protein [Candidatus Desulfofervidaceae bacterium]